MKIEIIAGITAAIIVIIAILIIRIRKAKMKEEMDEINVRFNEVRSFPIAYKLTKAQEMAKRNEETAKEINSFFDQYEEVQKKIECVEEKMEEMEDAAAFNKAKEVSLLKGEIHKTIDEIEKEIKSIDAYLDRFAKEEDYLNRLSFKLREAYGEIRNYVDSNSAELMYVSEGINEKKAEVEALFKEGEDFFIAHDYAKANETYGLIDEKIRDMKEAFKELPELIHSAKGVLPVLLEEVDKQYTLTRQRGINLDSYRIEDKCETIQSKLNADMKNLLSLNINEERKHFEESQTTLKQILNDIEKENTAFIDCKAVLKQMDGSLNDLKKLIAYVSKGYDEQRERFGMEDLRPYLADSARSIKEYEKKSNAFARDVEAAKDTPCNLLSQVNELYNDSEVLKKSLMSYKMKVDKTTSDEQRAATQLQKLQLIMNEMEVKVREYRLPSISKTYYEDIEKSREYIAEIETLLNGVPIDTVKLDASVKQAVSFIYTFYNNVNNIVGMAMMVENAIVFANKYRSTYSEVDQELSKAEFYYMNGEYTKALTITIRSMEKLYPNVSDKKMLENA